MNTVRLLPLETADGPTNMASDEALLEAAVAGNASLRFYTWAEPTLSLGYFQPESVRHSDARLAELPWVRRPSGGGALVHHHELTYALALPAGFDWQPKGESWICRFHGCIAKALNLEATNCNEERKLHDVLCFLHHTPGDLILNGAKVAGSAQRKLRGAFLQHGAVLLAQSSFTPLLPGIRERAGAVPSLETIAARVCHEFYLATGWQQVNGDWSAAERSRIAELVREKYSNDEWNRKR